MTNTVLQSRPSQNNHSRGAYLIADVCVLLFIGLVGLGLLSFFQSSNIPMGAQTIVRTDLWALPEYALLSLTRSFIALFLSFAFAIAYGTLAAKSRRNETVMIPLLDVLQALPVLTFLPGFVLALTALFPSSRWGLEFSCILMIFTGQVWNLVYAYYGSQRNLSPELTDFVSISRLTGVQRFLLLDLPNGLRPLIYNGMMSMSGGWFFLTLCESFTLGNRSFQLPGLGSYLMKTFKEGHTFNFCAGLAIMILLILGCDFLIWRPLVAWVSQYNDQTAESAPRSFVLSLLRTTRLPLLTKDFIESQFQRIREAKIARTLLKSQAQNRQNSRSGKSSQAALPFGTSRWVSASVSVFSSSQRKKPLLPWAIVGQWIISFMVGALVFWALPKLPELGKAMGTVDGQTWLQLTSSLGNSFFRVFAVLFLASLWTVPVGLWIGRRRKLAKYLEPIVQNLAAFPAPVLYPLFTQFTHTRGVPSDLIAILLMTVGNQWYILFNVIAGTFLIKPELVEVANLYQFSKWKKFRYVYWPALYPSLITGWVTAAGGAWNASCVSEIVSYPGGTMVTSGIGAEIAKATAEANFPKLIAAVVVFTVAVVILNRSVWRTLNEQAARYQ